MHTHQWNQRRWPYLDSCRFQTFLVAAVPRVPCPDRGTITVQVLWAERSERFSERFERLAIDLLRECLVRAATRVLRISGEEADGVKPRTFHRGLGASATVR